LVGKKACVWQQRPVSRWQAVKLLLARWMSWYYDATLHITARRFN